MAKAKKPPVEPHLRRDWFRRFEEEGESPPQIAKADGYDVRTVRKQIEVERQDRERREARSMVLRNALEQHYRDLCSFAEDLEKVVSTEDSTLASARTDRKWSALREHLPRSKVWKLLDKWESTQDKIREAQKSAQSTFEAYIQANSPLELASAPDGEGISPGLVSALVAHSWLMARQEPGLLDIASVRETLADADSTLVELGAYRIGRIPNSRLSEVLDFAKGTLAEVANSPECDALRHLAWTWNRTRKTLLDELAVITMRRVVPGRCRYCPV